MSRQTNIQVSFDLAQAGQPIGNRFSNMSFWHYLGTTIDERTWHEWAEKKPRNWLADNYPWLKEMQIFIATGGSYLGYPGVPGDDGQCEFNRDLFVNPADRTNLTDYDFRPLVRACRNMLYQGVKPCLKLHAVPIKYTSKPKIGWFRVNVRPPDDYEVYYNYLKACVDTLVRELGLDEVRSWRWFVMTEMENKDWWLAEDESPETSKHEFLKMYDYSVATLEDSLGADHVKVGAHSMALNDGLWDDRDVLTHCVRGTNYKRGTRGTRLDFFAVSYYDKTPGKPDASFDLPRFSDAVKNIRDRANELGLTGLPIEVSEGGLCFGTDGKWLWHGLCLGGCYDVTWTALSFKKMIDCDVTTWSRWPSTRTAGIFRGIETGTTNLLRLMWKMRDDSVVPLNVMNPHSDEDANTVHGVAGYNQATHTAHVLVFSHGKSLDTGGTDETATLDLQHMAAATGSTATIKKWIIDEDHGDFWKQWVADRAARGITDNDYKWSRDQICVQHALKNQEHIDFWHSREDVYKALSMLAAEPEVKVVPKGNAVTFKHALRPFSVVFYEIENVRPASKE